jgi:hypothetical protein
MALGRILFLPIGQASPAQLLPEPSTPLPGLGLTLTPYPAAAPLMPVVHTATAMPDPPLPHTHGRLGLHLSHTKLRKRIKAEGFIPDLNRIGIFIPF